MKTVSSLQTFWLQEDRIGKDHLKNSIQRVRQSSQQASPFAACFPERRSEARQAVNLPIYVYPVLSQVADKGILIDAGVFDIGVTRDFCSRGVGWRQITPVQSSEVLLEFNLPKENAPAWFLVEIRWSRQTSRGLDFGGVLTAAPVPLADALYPQPIAGNTEHEYC